MFIHRWKHSLNVKHTLSMFYFDDFFGEITSIYAHTWTALQWDVSLILISSGRECAHACMNPTIIPIMQHSTAYASRVRVL